MSGGSDGGIEARTASTIKYRRQIAESMAKMAARINIFRNISNHQHNNISAYQALWQQQEGWQTKRK